MHAGQNYTATEVIFWTSRETLVFLILAAIPTALYEVAGLTWITIPWLPIALLGTAVAFITGFKNNASYDRLWEARKIWGGIVNTSRSFALMALDFVTSRHAEGGLGDGEIEAAHTRILHRHIAWLAALRFQLRRPKAWETANRGSNAAYRRKTFPVVEIDGDIGDALSDVLSEDERGSVLSASNTATQILRKQSLDLKGLLARGLIEDFRHMEMQAMLTEMFTLQGKCERIKNFPYPRQFATLNLIFTWLFIVLVPFGLLPQFAQLGPHLVWLTVPFAALVAWIFHTIDKIGSVSENPFEGGANDVPITALSRTIEIDLREMLEEDDIPEPMTATNHILM